MAKNAMNLLLLDIEETEDTGSFQFKTNKTALSILKIAKIHAVMGDLGLAHQKVLQSYNYLDPIHPHKLKGFKISFEYFLMSGITSEAVK
jgi:hypothetical protein